MTDTAEPWPGYSGHYAYLRGTIVAIHDPSVRPRRFDVRVDTGFPFRAKYRVLCFLRKELEKSQ